jgi:hypothetical protein
MEEKREERKIKSYGINNFSKIDAPLIKPSMNGDYMKWGEKNDYPDYLLELYNEKSSIHKKIIDRKVKMISFYEFIFNNQIKDFIDNNWSDDTIQKIIKMISFDICIFNGFSLAIRWSRSGDIISSIDFIPFHKVRMSEDKSTYFISNNWSKWDCTYKSYPKFSILNNKNKVQIFYFKMPQPGVDYYPVPEYSAVITSIESDYRIGNFHYNNIKNGFSGGYAVIFKNGEPTIEQAMQQKADFLTEYSGDENGGNIVFLYARNSEEAPEIVPIPTSGNSELYGTLDERNIQKILTAHGVTNPILFGIKSANGLGSKDELIDALMSYQSLEIYPIQKEIENVFNKFIKINGLNGEIKMNKFTLDFGEQIEQIENSEYSDIEGDENLNEEVSEEIKNMTGRQFQGLQRVVRKYNKNEITWEQASLLLKGYGFNDDQIDIWIQKKEYNV